MQTEFEARFFKFPKDIKKQLIKAGFECVSPYRIMRVKVFHFKGNRFKWGRVRDEGSGVVTLSIKEVDYLKKTSLSGVKEVNLKIDSFDSGCAFLKACGLHEVSTQEKRRESWKNPEGVEVEFDTWPGLSEMIEIEADSERTVRHVAGLLNIDTADSVGSIDVYIEKKMGIPMDILNTMKEITFEKPLVKRFE